MLRWRGGGLALQRTGFYQMMKTSAECKQGSKNGLLDAIKSQRQLAKRRLPKMKNWQFNCLQKLKILSVLWPMRKAWKRD